MRARLVRPAFWADARMAELPTATRLTYVGLWCIADDAGYFEWDVRQIAGELYRFEGTKHRQTRVANDLDRLLDAGRVQRLACKEHGLIPSLARHRVQGGNLAFTVRSAHVNCPNGVVEAESIPMSTYKSRSESVSVSVSESVSGSLRSKVKRDPKTGRYAYAEAAT